MVLHLDQSLPRPLPSPSLVALLDLIPPSPILTTSDISTSSTSGDIPILLFDNANSSARLLDEQNEQCLALSAPRTWEFNLSRSSLDTPGLSWDGHTITNPSNDYRGDVLEASIQAACTSPRHRFSLCWTSDSDVAGDFIPHKNQSHCSNGGARPLIYDEDSWVDASQWRASSASGPLSEGDMSDDLSFFLSQPEPVRSGYLTGQDSNSRKPDLQRDRAPSENRNLVTLASAYVLEPSSSTRNRNSLSATQGRDPFYIWQFRDLLTPNSLADPCSFEETNPLEFRMERNSSAEGVSTHPSMSSLSRRRAIHRSFASPKHRKEFRAPNPQGDGILSRTVITPTLATAPRGDSTNTDCAIKLTFDGSPDIHSSVAAHRLPSPSGPPSTPLAPGVIQASSPAPWVKPTTPPRPNEQHKSVTCAWLQNSTVSLIIDQEGFRTIQPTFKHAGISKRRLIHSGNTDLEVATFVPTTKQTFRFHYAPFDGLPILRRLIVNGDESRDYLSRQAYLSLKSSGIYAVHGSELISAATLAPGPSSPDDESEAAHGITRAIGLTRLFWQFDYSVEDRRAEQTGRVLDGEKILIPLKFTCSPRLLHPSQGKKIKLIQIVKKTVVPKLTAEKKPADIIPSWNTNSNTATTSPATIITPPVLATDTFHRANQLYLNNHQVWSVHRRSQSNPREMPSEAALPPLSPPKPRHLPRHHNSTESRAMNNAASAPIPIPKRRRRASSAGENHIVTGISPPTRYILPPSRLRDLPEESSDDEETDRDQLNMDTLPFGRAPEGALDFFPLKPRPCFRH